MNHTKKMVLVPHETFDRIHNDRHDITKLDKLMLKVLNDTSLTDNEKWTQYNQVLQSYLFKSEQLRKPLKLPISEQIETSKKKDNLKHVILSSVPNKYKEKARQLYTFLREEPTVEWSQQGLVKIIGHELKSSSIVDLVNDLLRHRKNSNPNGWQHFALSLGKLNVPMEYIGNTTRIKYIRDNLTENYTYRGQTGSGKWRFFVFKR
jgi:hypothetical protein